MTNVVRASYAVALSGIADQSVARVNVRVRKSRNGCIAHAAVPTPRRQHKLPPAGRLAGRESLQMKGARRLGGRLLCCGLFDAQGQKSSSVSAVASAFSAAV